MNPGGFCLEIENLTKATKMRRVDISSIVRPAGLPHLFASL